MDKKLIYTFSLYFIASLLTYIVLVLFYNVPSFDYSIPLIYTRDGLFFCTVIKSIIDTKLYYINQFLSAPGIFNMAAFPAYSPYHYILVLFLSIFFKNFGSVMNTYYFATYFFTTVISLYTFRKLGLNDIFALVASLLFSFIPFHILRGELHLYLSNLFLVPIITLLAFVIYKHDNLSGTEEVLTSITKSYRKNIFLCSLCVFVGFFNLYAFFGCFVLLISGCIASVEKKTPASFFMALTFISIIFITLSLTLYPTILNTNSGDLLNLRGPAESEIYSLKITQLLLPTQNHRIHDLAAFTDKYNLSAPLVNENKTSSLGIIGSIGFLILLLILFIRTWQRNNTLFFLATMNLGVLLLSTVGGFSSLFAYTAFTIIRCYNRMSIFIAFFSFAAFFITLQLLLERFSLDRKKLVIFILSLSILIFGLLDQIPKLDFEKLYETNKKLFSDDAMFVKQIEKIMPSSSLIFQLPVMPYPEHGNIYEMADYQHFRPYLHSHLLRWSYGASRGESTITKWQQSVSTKPVEEMLREISLLEFTGLFINKMGFADNAKKIEKELNAIIDTPPITNADGTFIFYDLRSYINKLKAKNRILWSQDAKTVHNLTFVNVDWCCGKGFGGLEKDDHLSWRWGDKKSVFKIENSSQKNIPIELNFGIQIMQNEPADLFISGDLIANKLKITAEGISIKKKLLLTPGLHTLTFKTNAKRFEPPTDDPRSMYFRITNFSLKCS